MTTMPVSPTLQALPVVLECAPRLRGKVRYVFDTLMQAAGWTARYVSQPPAQGPWLLYAAPGSGLDAPLRSRCLQVLHDPQAWRLFRTCEDVDDCVTVDGLDVVLGDIAKEIDAAAADVRFDLPANAFYFLSAWSERVSPDPSMRRLFAHSVFRRLGVPQDIVDRYLRHLVQRIQGLRERLGLPAWPGRSWPGGATHAVLLSHDVDFLPAGRADVMAQAARTFARHLLRQHDPASALRGSWALLLMLARRRVPFCDLQAIIDGERRRGVRSSFQVAVARRHPLDVNYRIEDERVRQRLRVILTHGFDLCLHGSVCSTEERGAYEQEVAALAHHLARPWGSRQHYLSFTADSLFAAQERAGIRYDMSMGYPDRPGPRTGFSFPFFPWCHDEERPFRVLQIGLFLMDVTLRSYLGLQGERAWEVMDGELRRLREVRGAASVVWHPIVFGGCRDPGFDRLYWRMVDAVVAARGWATDGGELDAYWRLHAASQPSFAFAAERGAEPVPAAA